MSRGKGCSGFSSVPSNSTSSRFSRALLDDGVSSFVQAVPNFLNRNNGNYPVVFPKRKTYVIKISAVIVKFRDTELDGRADENYDLSECK